MRSKRYGWWMLASLLFALVTGLAPAGDGNDLATNTWKEFRKLRPHPIQTLAVSDRASDGSRVLIISEPPPHVTEAQLRQHSKTLAGLHVHTHKIGYDGWVKDAVVTLRTSDAETAELVSSLSRLLYHTTYKAHAVRLPVQPINLAPDALDHQATATDLTRWLTEKDDKFLPSNGGTPRTLAELTAEKRTGVFTTATPGLVVWWVPCTTRFRDCAPQMREFAIDSDLLLGALSNENGLLLIGRQRVLPADVLPPLRTETVALLTGVPGGHLAQSFERLSPPAGVLDDKSDWAPIYLSPELVDTEYGLLLIIADMIIKAWSNAGDTTYEGFLSAQPAVWPFKGPLPTTLKLENLTYNWNTAGAGYTVPVSGYSAFALNRTGALPVSYIPESAKPVGGMAKAEDTAYEYFAKLGDVQVMQVARYAALYQLAQAFWREKEPRPAESMWPAHLYTRRMEALLRSARDASDALLEQATAKMAANVQGRIGVHETGLLMKSNKGKLQFLQRILKNYSDLEIARLCRGLADGGYRNPFQISTNLLNTIASLENFPEKYAQEVDAHATGWQHTPAVVVSTNVKELAKLTGGHNIDASVPRFEASDQVASKQVRVDMRNGKVIIRYNPEDASSIERASRLIGRRARSTSSEQIEAEVRRYLENSTPPPPRDPATALGMPPPPPNEPPPAARLGAPFPNEPGRGMFTGSFPLAGTIPAEIREQFSNGRDRALEAIVVTHEGENGFRVYDLLTNEARGCFTYEAAVETIQSFVERSPGDVRTRLIRTRNFPPERADGLAVTLRLGAEAGNRGRPIRILVDAPGWTAAQVEAAFRRPYDFTRRSPSTATRVANNEIKVETTAPAADRDRPSVILTSHVFAKKALPATERVRAAFDQAVAQEFPQNSDFARARLERFHQRFFDELRQISDDPEEINGLLHEIRLEGQRVQVGRKENPHDAQHALQ
jgi:hypothetical protein